MAAPAASQQQNVRTHEAPFSYAAAVAPNDGADIPGGRPTSALYIGGAGSLNVDLDGDGGTVAFAAVPAGTTIRIAVRRVRATGTAATSIVALW
jgi:hypothetical protein